MAAINRDDVAHLARLAHIEMSAEELDRMAGELAVIVDSVKSVSEAAGGCSNVQANFSVHVDAEMIKRRNQLHQRIDIAPDHALARFHALNGWKRKPSLLGQLALV